MGHTGAMSETRKIAAILVADVVGYSRLAEADEERVLARLRALRSDLIDPTISLHHGRIVKRTGDGRLRVVVYAAADRTPVAKAALAETINLNPKLSVAWFHAHNSAWIDTAPDFREALIKAGLPEE
jgi:class 3 adenylate cyclase